MAALNKYLELEGIDKLRQYIKDIGRKVEFKKGQLFFEQDCICKVAGYIQSGGFRYLSYTSTGKEQIVGYSFENDFVADYGSLMNNSFSIANAQAIKKSVILVISRDELLDFYNNYCEIDFRSKLAEIFLADVYNRLISLYCDTPKERYLKLIQQSPEIFNEVSLREIASFVRITPETLSRIRKNMSVP